MSFLEHSDEINELIIPESELKEKFGEGVIVNIQKVDFDYKVNVLKMKLMTCQLS